MSIQVENGSFGLIGSSSQLQDYLPSFRGDKVSASKGEAILKDGNPILLFILSKKKQRHFFGSMTAEKSAETKTASIFAADLRANIRFPDMKLVYALEKNPQSGLQVRKRTTPLPESRKNIFISSHNIKFN